jgi:hypothetical protein
MTKRFSGFRPPARGVRRAAAPALAAALLLAAIGCVERSIEVRTDPPGARVYLDREFRGLSPLSIPFHHYGVREVAVEKEGYGRETRTRTVAPPWFEVFPLDLLFDGLVPFPLADRREFEFRLAPSGGGADPGREGLEERAERARDALRGDGEPG